MLVSVEREGNQGSREHCAWAFMRCGLLRCCLPQPLAVRQPCLCTQMHAWGGGAAYALAVGVRVLNVDVVFVVRLHFTSHTPATVAVCRELH